MVVTGLRDTRFISRAQFGGRLIRRTCYHWRGQKAFASGLDLGQRGRLAATALHKVRIGRCTASIARSLFSCFQLIVFWCCPSRRPDRSEVRVCNVSSRSCGDSCPTAREGCLHFHNRCGRSRGNCVCGSGGNATRRRDCGWMRRYSLRKSCFRSTCCRGSSRRRSNKQLAERRGSRLPLRWYFVFPEAAVVGTALGIRRRCCAGQYGGRNE